MTELAGGVFLSKKTDSLELRCSTVGYILDNVEVNKK